VEEDSEGDKLGRTKNKDRRWRSTKPNIFGMNVPEFEKPALKTVPDSCVVPYDFFKLFVDDKFVDKIVTTSRRYAAKKNKPDVVEMLTRENIRVTQAIMALSGYLSPSQRLMYWELREDTMNSLVRKSMARNTFKAILSNTHFVEGEDQDHGDRFWKVRPLFNQLNNSAKALVTQTECVSINEGMIKYYGPNSLKQRIVGKPIRMGYKMWILATSEGQLLAVQPYAGAATHLRDYGLGQGPKVVMALSVDYGLLPGTQVIVQKNLK